MLSGGRVERKEAPPAFGEWELWCRFELDLAVPFKAGELYAEIQHRHFLSPVYDEVPPGRVFCKLGIVPLPGMDVRDGTPYGHTPDADNILKKVVDILRRGPGVDDKYISMMGLDKVYSNDGYFLEVWTDAGPWYDDAADIADYEHRKVMGDRRARLRKCYDRRYRERKGNV